MILAVVAVLAVALAAASVVFNLAGWLVDRLWPLFDRHRDG